MGPRARHLGDDLEDELSSSPPFDAMALGEHILRQLPAILPACLAVGIFSIAAS